MNCNMALGNLKDSLTSSAMPRAYLHGQMSTFLRTLAGDLVIPRVLVTEFNAVCLQRVIDVLALWQGSFFLDLSQGTPWLTILGQKTTSTQQAALLLTTQIQGVVGVTRVVAKTSVDRVRRAFFYSFTAFLNSGAQITGGSGVPTNLTGGS